MGSPAEDGRRKFAVNPSTAALMVGAPTAGTSAFASAMRSRMPLPLAEAVSHPYSARAVVFALLLDRATGSPARRNQEEGLIHPRLFGTAGRVLGRCVRDVQLFTLEEAIYKLAGFPAKRFGLVERWMIRESFWADLVSFDAKTVNDQATFDHPRQFSTGFGNVWVNGVPIWDHDKIIVNEKLHLPGRFLRRGKL